MITLILTYTHITDRTFEDVRSNLLKETQRSFIARYLRRRDTKDDLAGCDISLTNALNLFSVSIIHSTNCFVDLYSFVTAQGANSLRAAAQGS